MPTSILNRGISRARRPGGGGGAGTFAATHALGVGKLTMGQAIPKGQVPAGSKLAFAGLPTQFDLKTTWDDGSARVAVLSADVTSGGSYPLAVGTAATGSFTPTLPTARVEFALHTRCMLLGVYAITSGTARVTLAQVTSGKRIVADTVVLENTADGTTYVLDDADGTAFSTTGTGWNTLSGPGWPGGGSVRWTKADGATATWTKASLPSGTYSVAASWTDWTSAADQGSGDPRATFTVKDNTTTIGTIKANQVVASAECVGRILASNFTVSSGTCTATLTNQSADGLVVADAVALFKGGVLVSVIDDADAGCAFAGTAWLEAGVGWPVGYARGYADTYRIANWSSFAGDGSSTATYTWTGLASGTDYTLVAWSLFSPYSTAELDITMQVTTTAHWAVKDGATSRATPVVNQRDWGAHDLVETYRAPLGTSESADLWLAGGVVREHRQAVAPYYVDSGGVEHAGTAHPTLRVVYDVRAYSDGAGKLMTIVENGLDVTAGTYAHYDTCTITLDGSTAVTYSNVEHWYGARWIDYRTFGGLSEASLAADWSPAYAAKMLMKPRATCDTGVVTGFYDPSAGGRVGSSWSTSDPHFAILRRGALDGDGLGGGGLHTQLGTEPTWSNQFLAHGNADARDYMLAGSRFSGSYPHHFRDAATGEPINVVARPNATFNYSQSPASFLQADALRGQQDLANSRFGRWQMSANTPHNPTLSQVPYLYTGERYHYEEIVFWANYPLLANIPSLREDASCYPNDGAGSRGIGWQVFGYAKAASVALDASPMKSYLRTVVENCQYWLDQYAQGGKNFGVNNKPYASILGCAFDENLGNTALRIVGMAIWQNMYVALGIQKAIDLGFPLTGGAPDGSRLLNVILNYMIDHHGQYDAAHPDDPAYSTFPFHLTPTLVVNGSFHAFCTDQANTPQDWTVAVGTPGTHVLAGAYADSFCTDGAVKLVSDGSTLTSLTHKFSTTPSVLAGAGGTPDTLPTSTSLYGIFHLKASSAPTTGTLVVDLIDGSGTPLAGCSKSVALNTLTTSYRRFNIAFATPSSISGTPRLRVRFSAAPDSGRTVYLGDIALWSATGAGVLECFYNCDARWNPDNTTFDQFSTWDQSATASIVNGRTDGQGNQMPVPCQLGAAEYAYMYLLAFNLAEARGLASGTARYDALAADPGNLSLDAFNVVRGLYA